MIDELAMSVMQSEPKIGFHTNFTRSLQRADYLRIVFWIGDGFPYPGWVLQIAQKSIETKTRWKAQGYEWQSALLTKWMRTRRKAIANLTFSKSIG